MSWRLENFDSQLYVDEFRLTTVEIPQENHHYAFGLDMAGVSKTAANPHSYTYNGKELQAETGWHDYGARMYDGQIGRWGAVDPLAGKYVNVSEYTYVLNNPIIHIDPNGADVDDPIKNLILLIGGNWNLNEIIDDLLSNDNENWSVVFAENYEAAANTINELSGNGENKLNNLVIASHGTVDGINADGKGVFGKDVAAYNAGMSKGDTFFGQDQSWMYGNNHKMSKSKFGKISAMTSIAQNVADGGSIIFTACRACANNTEERLGDDLGSNLVMAFDSRVNVYLNGDPSRMSKPGRSYTRRIITQKDKNGNIVSRQVVDVPIPIIGGSLTYGDVDRGWTRFGSDGSIDRVGELNLNLRGNPVSN